MFGNYVGAILRAMYLDAVEVPGTDSVLYPEICDGKIADVSKSSPSTDPFCSAGVRLNGEAEVDAKISGYCNEAQRCARTLSDASQFRLCAGNGNIGLCLAQVFGQYKS